MPLSLIHIWYTPQRSRAVWWTLGVIFSGMGLGTSALYSCIPPTFRKGRTARLRTMIPMPPSHWVRSRQKRMPLGLDWISVSTVAPVVVKPDMASKNASV